MFAIEKAKREKSIARGRVMAAALSPEAIHAALAVIPAKDYDLSVRVGAAIKSELGDAGFDLWGPWNLEADEAGFDERAVRDVWNSIKPNGATIDSLFAEAEQRGFKPDEQQAPPPAPAATARVAEHEKAKRLPRKAKRVQSALTPAEGDKVVHLATPDRELPAPPYPSSIKARGWSFDLDVERLESSDTWALAPAELRPWLLMLWMTAWRSIPVGSLPADDVAIAARIGMPLKRFRASREILLRGWRPASGSRLYHPVVTEKVLAMIAARRNDVDRKALERARKAAKPAAPDSNGVTRDSTVNPTPTPTPTPTTTTPSSSASPPTRVTPDKAIPDCPHEQIIDLFHQALPMCPRVARWGGRRAEMLRTLWREEARPDKFTRINGHSAGYSTVEEGLAWWRQFFGYVAQSAFLTGRAAGRDSRPWIATLPWLLKPENFAKVIEGNYA